MRQFTQQLTAAIARSARRLRDSEVGEGVISTAIAVLILAFVGAGMYVGFNSLMNGTCDEIGANISEGIGDGASNINCDAP